jgi:4-hydroxybenzoate polyprenyltransferase
MHPVLEALRPWQWVKNLLLFAPLLFTTRVAEVAGWLAAGTAFAAFCLAASSVYLLNDILDREEDACHPKKRLRPIASGRLRVGAAWCVLAATVAGAAGVATLVPGSGFVWWPLAYLTLNLAYSLRLKKIVIVDCMCIAIGFQLRVQAGAVAIAVEASNWLLLCTFFFSLFLAFCKRYEELGRQSTATGQTRATMAEYSTQFLNMLIGPLAALSILTYALYTVSPETVQRHGTTNLMYTVPIVTYGVFRYLFLVYRREEGGDPARLLFRDVPLLASGALYGLVVVTLLQAAHGA